MTHIWHFSSLPTNCTFVLDIIESDFLFPVRFLLFNRNKNIHYIPEISLQCECRKKKLATQIHHENISRQAQFCDQQTLSHHVRRLFLSIFTSYQIGVNLDFYRHVESHSRMQTGRPA